MSEHDICKWKSEKEMSSKTVVVLKAELSRLSLPTSGRKADLISRLIENVRNVQGKLEENEAKSENSENAVSAAKSPNVCPTSSSIDDKRVPIMIPISDEASVSQPNSPAKHSQNEDSDGIQNENASEDFVDETESCKNNIIKDSQAAEMETPQSAKEDDFRSKELSEKIRESSNGPLKSCSPPQSEDKSWEAQDLFKEEEDVHVNSSEQDETTVSLRIDNFVRPFTINQARELIENAAGVDLVEFWMDKIKTHAIVTLPSEKAAKRVYNALHDLQWPERSSKVLSVSDSSISAQEAIEKAEKNDRETKRKKLSSAPETQRSAHGKESRSESIKQDASVDFERGKRTEIDEPAISLDDLYRKTNTLPIIYWQPNDDEQASNKKSKRNVPPTMDIYINSFADIKNTFDLPEVVDVMKSQESTKVQKKSPSRRRSSQRPSGRKRSHERRREDSRSRKRRY